MKKIRKLLSLLLATAMLTAVPVVAEEVTQDVENTAVYKEDYGLLKALGILNDEDLTAAPNERVSRAEFAVYISKLGNVGVGEAKGIFNDVMKGSAEEAYIEAAVATTYINPKIDGYFYPAYPITKTEVLMAILKIYGYADFEKNGIDPYSQNVTRNVLNGVKSGEEISREDVYKMLYQCLFEHPVVMSLGNGSFKFKEDKDKTILGSFFNVDYVKDIVKSAGLLGKDSGRKVLEIKDKSLFMPENMAAADIIGRNVKCYYDTDTNNIVYIQKYKNSEMHFSAEDDVGYSNLTYNYGDNKKAELYAPVVYYNNSIYTGELTKEIMAPDDAEITLVDNNDDGKYEVVIITVRFDYYVRLSNMSDEWFFIDYVTGEQILFNNRKDLSVYDETGREMDFSNIREGSVVSVEKNATNGIASVYVSSATVAVKALGMGETEDGDEYIKCDDGNNYYISSYLKNAFKNGGVLTPVKGKNYILYMNIDGKVVFISEENATKRNYGILTKAFVDGMGDDGSVRIFSKVDGGFKTYMLAKSVTFNGKSVKDHEKIIDSLKYDGVPADGKTKHEKIVGQFVEFDKNDDDEIYMLQQALNSGNTIDEFSGLQCHDEGSIWSSGAGWLQRSVGKNEGNQHEITMREDTTLKISILNTASCITFSAPYITDDSGNFLEMAVDDEGLFKLTNIKINTRYEMIGFKENSDTECLSAAIIKTPTGGGRVPEQWNNYMVDDISYGVDKDNMPVSLLKLEGTTYELAGEFDVNNLEIFDYKKEVIGYHKLQVGDIVNVSINDENRIVQIEPLFDSVERKFFVSKLDAILSPLPTYKGEDTYFCCRGRIDGGDCSHILYTFHLYKQEGGFMFGAPRNADNVGNFDPYTYDAKVDPIYILQRPSKMRYFDGEKARAGSMSDLIGFKESKEAYVDVVIDYAYSMGRKMWIYPHRP